MVRPRISENEAKFLVRILEFQEKLLEARRQVIQNISDEVLFLKHRVICDTYRAIVTDQYPEKKELSEKLLYDKFGTYDYLSIIRFLIRKYKAIYEGTHKGRWKAIGTSKVGPLPKRGLEDVLISETKLPQSLEETQKNLKAAKEKFNIALDYYNKW